MNILDTIERFVAVHLQFTSVKKSTVKSFLTSDKDYSLVTIYGSGQLVPSELAHAIKESVAGYTKKKDTAISVYRAFIRFLKKQYDIDVVIDFPPIPVSIPLERAIFIAKYLHNPENRVDALPDILWVNQRTIEDDLARLRGNKDPVQIAGNRLVITETDRSMGTISMPSTAHPLFLIGNLSQTLVLLKGLKSLNKDSVYKPHALSLAENIWAQLSDFAKTRILQLYSDAAIDDDVTWYKALGRNETGRFQTERETSSSEGSGFLLDCLKSRKPCFIEYLDRHDKIKIYAGCEIINVDRSIATVHYNEQSLRLVIERILRSGDSMEALA